MEQNDILNRLIDELNSILILLERPVVQQQLMELTIVLLVSWLLSLFALRLLRRVVRFRNEQWRERAIIIAQELAFPLTALVLLQIIISGLAARGLPTGFLNSTRPLLYLVLGYEIFIFLLSYRYSAAAIRPYRQLILLPALALILIYLIISNFINVGPISQLPLLTLLGGTLTVGVLIRSLLLLYLFGVFVYLMRRVQRRISSQKTENSAFYSSMLIVGRYAIIVLGVLALAASLGLNLATLAVIGGGLSIGIGFSLQQIVANFISGILMLFEQSLRPGDVIEVGDELGYVQQVNIRSTTLQTNDNVQIIVPNEQFMTNNIRTYTRNAALVRVSLVVGVSYDSDPQAVRDLLIETVKQHGNVKEKPAPEVFFHEFGASSIDFRVLVWMDNPIQIPRFRSDLHYMIWNAFKAHDIEIPFPQRDLHLRSGWSLPSSDE